MNFDPIDVNPFALLYLRSIFAAMCYRNMAVQTEPPVINLGFTGDPSNPGNQLITVMDTSTMYQFIKVVPQKTKANIPLHTVYAVPKRWCDFIVYGTGNTISDSVLELVLELPDYTMETFVFEDEDGNAVDPRTYTGNVLVFDAVSGDLIVDNRISNVVNATIGTMVAYYIRPENTNYVHCIMKQKTDDEESRIIDPHRINAMMMEYQENDEVTDETINAVVDYIFRTAPGTALLRKIEHRGNRDKSTSLKPQIININIARFMSQVLRPWIFLVDDRRTMSLSNRSF
jgi:hypothetical protein